MGLPSHSEWSLGECEGCAFDLSAVRGSLLRVLVVDIPTEAVATVTSHAPLLMLAATRRGPMGRANPNLVVFVNLSNLRFAYSHFGVDTFRCTGGRPEERGRWSNGRPASPWVGHDPSIPAEVRT